MEMKIRIQGVSFGWPRGRFREKHPGYYIYLADTLWVTILFDKVFPGYVVYQVFHLVSKSQVHSVHSVHSVHCKLHTAHSILHTAYCTQHTAHSILHTAN